MPARARRACADAIRQSRDGKTWERRKARTATTEKPVCETRAAGVGARSCAPAKAPVRESPAMLRRPAIVRVVCCVHVCARKCRNTHPRDVACTFFILLPSRMGYYKHPVPKKRKLFSHEKSVAK